MAGKTNILAVLAVIISLAAGCRPVVNVDRPEDYGHGGSDFSTAFESLWTGMNTNYVFWDLEPLGYWDDMWNTYRPKFDDLTRRDVPTADGNALLKEARGYFAEMLNPLRDGHLYVSFDERFGLAPIEPAYARVMSRYPGAAPENNNPGYAFLSDWSEEGRLEGENYNIWKTLSNYTGFVTGPVVTEVDGIQLRAAVGRIASGDGFILYLYFSNFYLQLAAAQGAKNTHPDYNLNTSVEDILIRYYVDVASPKLKGVIFDLRGNTGGANADMDLLLGRLIQEPLLFAYTRYKNGPNRLEYKPWIPYYVLPHEDPGVRTRADVPVVALVNDFSISCGELLPLAVKAMPQGHLIGTRTWGATGPRISSISPAPTNGGSFANISGNVLWNNVVQAGFQTKGADGANYEGVGIEPDEVVPFDWAEFYGGRDRQLEAAIEYIR